jgi:uncharacterized DUF497 family protein
MAFRFEWDEAKNRLNRKRHGVPFEVAQTAFFDENARLTDDPDQSDDEDRFILLGLSVRLRVLVAAHSYRQLDETIRIISARRADPSERREYSGWLK